MNFFAVLLFVVAAIAKYQPAKKPIPDCYIVKFFPDTPNSQVAAHKANFHAQANWKRQWSRGKFKGYSICSKNKNLIRQIERKPEVELVEEDGELQAHCVTQTHAPWGLVRTAVPQLKLARAYNYGADGTGVTVYVIDSGINLGHADFEGRATLGVNLVGTSDSDGYGHGTHCAGIIGGAKFGMAKKARLVAVKVLDDTGFGGVSDLISGLDWVVANKARGPVVASVSVGSYSSPSMDAAAENAVAEGVIMVVAAGNDMDNACNYSPYVPSAIVVAASDNKDNMAPFSNYGNCVDLFAPGVNISSTWIGSPTATKIASGTSMACPHVAGQVAKYLQTNPTASVAAVKTWLTSRALPNVIKNVPPEPKTPNLLLFSDCSLSG